MSYRIAEAAAKVGVPTSTLRYYEDIGLIDAPDRGANGYRVYDEGDLARLGFITSAKNLGIPLTDVKALAAAYDVEDCTSVAHQVVEMIAVRLTQTQDRIAELVSLAAQLQAVSARLADAPGARACGADCPCSTAAVRPLEGRTLIPLTRAASTSTSPAPPTAPSPPSGQAEAPGEPIACSLEAAAVPERVTGWQAVVAQAVARRPITGGVSLTFPADVGLAAEVARLAAAEQQCCTFFTFTVQLTTGSVRLDVQAPDEAAEVVAAMFGVPV